MLLAQTLHGLSLPTLLLVQLLSIIRGDQEIYGDIYPNTKADLKMYYNMQYTENKCFRNVPAALFQTKENEPVIGNASILYHHRLEVCCEGYREASSGGGKCIPDCSKVSANNCRHGFCRAPQHCECYEGFVRNAVGNCVHTCPVACENGRCLLDGTCICNPGYSLDPETRKFCVADCSHIACGLNQRCVAPGECRCIEGYQWLDSLGCQPICHPHCGHGRCVAPNECECFAGFIKRPERNFCEAECFINCANGFCESRYKCLCHIGFNYDPHTQTCLPHCPDGCEHGVCTAPGICKCFEGYFLRDNTCRPICENGCGLHGICVAPNICACGPEQQHCLGGGLCSSQGKCICPQGMTHFIDRCLHASTLENGIFKYEDKIHYNKQLKYEFRALIGRMFEF